MRACLLQRRLDLIDDLEPPHRVPIGDGQLLAHDRLAAVQQNRCVATLKGEGTSLFLRKHTHWSHKLHVSNLNEAVVEVETKQGSSHPCFLSYSFCYDGLHDLMSFGA